MGEDAQRIEQATDKTFGSPSVLHLIRWETLLIAKKRAQKTKFGWIVLRRHGEAGLAIPNDAFRLRTCVPDVVTVFILRCVQVT